MDAYADPRTDAELLAAVADGDRDAMSVLYGRHAPWLVLRLSRRCADPSIVDETVQDTFLAVWRSAGKYTGQGEVAAWMWGIGVRRLIDTLRRQPVATVVLTEPTRTEISAEEQVLLGVEYGDLAGALHTLSPELHAVVQATVLDGLTTREASRLLGIPPGTVKTRMMRARAALREELV
ncbi:MAG TPA: RNA polymerase sigma factor [Mycobacteriales bacterium]|nr:RNA polymerase sigma factor [Mycobacteriales bacterium]